MAGAVPAIHVFLDGLPKDVDARDKPGHDECGFGRAWCCAANMHRSSSVRPLSFGASVLYLGKGGKATLGGNPMAMTMNGEVQLAASRQMVWEKLNDPEVLKVCIPG